MNTIAHRVNKVRKDLGLNQEELGKRINYSRSYISMIERGKQPTPDAEFVERIEALEKHGMNTTLHSRSTRLSEDGGATPIMPPPPHHELEHAYVPRGMTPAASGLDPQDYVQCVSWLSYLFDRKPEAFKMVKAVIETIHNQNKTP